MRRLLIAFATVMLCLAGLVVAAPAETNPISGNAPAAEHAEPGALQRLVAPFGRALVAFNREINRQVASNMRAVRDGSSPFALLIAIALAFGYGAVHTLGPGHGKTVVLSYFLSRDARIARGLWVGVQIAVTHVIAAIVVVALADYLLRRLFGGVPAEIVEIRLVSYGLIACIGGALLVQALRHSRGHGGHHHHCHAHAGAGGTTLMSLGVGLIPCTGAVLVMLYALANGIVVAGVLIVIAISAGMALAMAALGIGAILLRRFAFARLADGDAHRHGMLSLIVEIGGALVILLLGTALFLGTWLATAPA